MKAIALISGGLDSILAARIIKDQGTEIIPLNFKIPFSNRNKKIPSGDKGINLDKELKIVNISNDFLDLLIKPQHGFGANLNPCIDCKILMLRKAGELMKEFDAQFVVTGEVLGQRPMSQHIRALETIEKKSGLEGLVLRPLSAKLLTETTPEKNGWVDRNKLLNFSGRTRRPQMNLARDFHIDNYPNASGGCLLTDPQFTKRLKELIGHQELSMDNIELLKIGRHFRIAEKTKLIVGRDEEEDKELEKLTRENDYLFMPAKQIAGPTSLGRGEFNEDFIKLSCQITCRYCDLNGKITADIVYKKISESEDRVLEVSPIEKDGLESLRI